MKKVYVSPRDIIKVEITKLQVEVNIRHHLTDNSVYTKIISLEEYNNQEEDLEALLEELMKIKYNESRHSYYVIHYTIKEQF